MDKIGYQDRLIYLTLTIIITEVVKGVTEERNVDKKHFQDSLANLTKSYVLVKRLIGGKRNLDQISYEDSLVKLTE